MSLIAWYPLNGDLDNYGVGDMDLSVTSSPTFVNGKIGKGVCGGGDATWTAEQTARVLNNNELSIAFWCKVNSVDETVNTRAAFFGTIDYVSANNNRKFSIFNYPTFNDLHLSWENDTASQTFAGGIWKDFFPTGEWVHFCVVYKNPNIIVYRNGVKYATTSGVSNSSTFGYQTQVFRSNPGRIVNDYRFYNHALSPKEVKEISKGLVLHYPLNNTLGDDLTNGAAIYDTSGYKNNGTVDGALVADSDSAVGQSSVKFDANCHVHVSSLPTAGLADSYTFSWWAKGDIASDMMWGFQNGNRLNYYSGHYCNTGDSGSNPFKTSSGDTIAIPASTAWHHYAMVGNGTATLLYLDGTLYGTATTYRPVTGSTIYLNGWDSTANYNFNGSISDFRIYATALSAQDIKELYQTRFSIADNGTLFCGEYVENDGSNVKFGKNGVVTVADGGSGLGRENLLKDSHVANRNASTESYPAAKYDLVKKVEAGKTYTWSVNISTTGLASTAWIDVYFGGGSYGTGAVTLGGDVTDKTISRTFTANANQANMSNIHVYVRKDASTMSLSGTPVKVNWAKIEEGKGATPWCPSISDTTAYTPQTVSAMKVYDNAVTAWQIIEN